MIFSANISKALCLAAMGISLMMPAPVAAATLLWLLRHRL